MTVEVAKGESKGNSTRIRSRSRSLHPDSRTLATTLRAYLALTKPRIIELLLIVTVPAMVAARRGIPPIGTVVATIVGGTMAAGGANAINNYFDRDIDARMARTRSRPIPAHEISPRHALGFGVILGCVAFVFLGFTTNWLASSLAVGALAFYVIVYTLVLKRRTPQNIVIGGAAGGVPALVGWAAVRGKVEFPAVVLFFLVFYWTPPHFWALAIRYKDDYAAAEIPMLPVTRGVVYTAEHIVLYSWLTVAMSLLFFAVGGAGVVYLTSAAILGIELLRRSYALRSVARQTEEQRDAVKSAMHLFKYSNVYLALLSVAIVVDVMVSSSGLS
jgi:protoheme IX farnesyltransferase